MVLNRKRVVIAAALLLLSVSSCGGARANDGWMVQGTNIDRWHDPELPVTCWAARNYATGGIGISCIPDASIKE